MSRKLLSITVALLLILTVFAVMPVSAAGGVAFESDFEEGNSDGWSMGTDMKIENVDGVTGYDGSISKAGKITIKDEMAGVAITGSSPGSLRGNFSNIAWESSGDTVGLKPSVTIEKIDIYLDEANWLKGGGYFSFGQIRFNPTVTDGVVTSVYCYSRAAGNDTVGIGTLRSGWNRIVVVRNYPTPGSTEGATMSAWLNDEIKVLNASSPRFPATGKAAIQFYAGTYNSGEYLMIDNVEISYDPAPAEIISSIPTAGSEGVDVDTKEIILNFSDKVTTNTEGGAISKNNFPVSGGVEVEGIEISADGKSVKLVIDSDFRMEFETTYAVSVSGIKDLGGNTVSGSISFKTEKMPDYEYSVPVFRKIELLSGSEGEVIESLENGYVSCNYSVTNYKNEAQPALMFVVLYENGFIKDFIFNPQSIAANGGSEEIYSGFNVTDAANSKIQAYAWNDFSASNFSLMPMYTIDANGIHSTAE